MSVVRGHSKKTSCRDIIEADKASIRKGIYKVLRTGMAAMTHLLILRKSSIWSRRAEDILTTHPGTYQQDVLESFFSLSIMVKWMIDVHNATHTFTGIF